MPAMNDYHAFKSTGGGSDGGSSGGGFGCATWVVIVRCSRNYSIIYYLCFSSRFLKYAS